MSRKRSSEVSARDNKVETSGVLFELEDSRDKEKLSVRQRQGRRQGLRETEREKQDFDEITEGFSQGISTRRKKPLTVEILWENSKKR